MERRVRLLKTLIRREADLTNPNLSRK